MPFQKSSGWKGWPLEIPWVLEGKTTTACGEFSEGPARPSS